MEITLHPVVQDVAETAELRDPGCHLVLCSRVWASVSVQWVDRLPEGQGP